MLPDEAIKYINKKAEELLKKLEVQEQENPKSKKREESSIDHRQSVELKGEDIENLIGSTVDQEGTPLSFHFIKDNKQIGLSGDQYKEYFDFIKSLSERKEFRLTVSFKKLDSSFISWFKLAYQNNEHPPASDFVLEEIKNSITRLVIRFPIQHISISKSFWVGKVHFSYLK